MSKEYIERFKQWFAAEDGIEWRGLTGLCDASSTVFFGEIPSGLWHREVMQESILSTWKDSEDLSQWQKWLLRGLESQKVNVRWQTYDLTQVVERPNRWKHKDNTTTKRLVPGDVVCPKATNRKYQFGYDVSAVLHTAEQIFKTKPTLIMPNIPIPAIMIAPDGSCALFVFPIVGEEEQMPHLYVLSKDTASFGDFFSA